MEQELYKKAKAIKDKLHLAEVTLKDFELYEQYKEHLEQPLIKRNGVLQKSTIESLYSLIVNDLKCQISDLTNQFEQL